MEMDSTIGMYQVEPFKGNLLIEIENNLILSGWPHISKYWKYAFCISFFSKRSFFLLLFTPNSFCFRYFFFKIDTYFYTIFPKFIIFLVTVSPKFVISFFQISLLLIINHYFMQECAKFPSP